MSAQRRGIFTFLGARKPVTVAALLRTKIFPTSLRRSKTVALASLLA